MSNLKISEMVEAESLNNNDLLTIVQNGVNKKITKTKALGNIITALNDPTYITGTGTVINLDNTRVGRLKSTIKGNTEQNTTEGKQLIDFATLSNSNTSNLFTGDLLVVSTSSGTYANAYKDITALYKNNPNKVLRFDFDSITSEVTPTIRIVGLRVVDNGTATNYTLVDNNKSISTHTIPADTSNITSASLTIYANNTATATTNAVTIKKPMFHFGATLEGYEIFTGGIAAPNPDYPEEIKVVTGENTISISSKNVFNGANITSYHTSNASFSVIDTGVRVTNTATNTGTNFVTLPILNVSNYVGQKFTLRTTWTKTGGADGQVILGLCDASGGNRVAGVYGYTSGEAVTYTIPTLSSATYLACWFYANTAGSVTAGDYTEYTNVQIELGDTATPYEPHKENSYKISLGNTNEFDKNNINLIDGYYVDNSAKVVAGSNNKFNWVELSPNYDYILYQPKKSNVTVRVALFSTQPAASSTGTLIGTFSGTDSAIYLKFKTTSTNYFVGWVYCNTSNLNGYTQQEMINSILLFKGTELIDYSENPIDLCKIGDSQDYIYKKGANWYKSKIIEKITLTGSSSENWGLYSAVGSSPRRFGLNDTTRFYMNSIPIMSDYFIGDNIPGSLSPDLAIWTQTNYLGITDKNSYWADVTALKTWLASHNVTVYYKLQTAQQIQITEQNLINQLNSLDYDSQSYLDVTNIMASGQSVDPIINIGALEKIV